MNRTACISLGVLAIVLHTALASGADPAAKPAPPKPPPVRSTVTASVEQGAGFIQAELVPGPFTVREGFKAGDLKFSYHDPKTGIQRNKLGPRDIYSVTLRRYIHEVVSDPLFALPPGEYKLAVGGQPGATGILGYTLTPSGPADDAKTGDTKKGNKDKVKADRTIDVVAWSSGREDNKTSATYYIRGTQVTGELECTVPGFEQPRFRAEPAQLKGTFEGTIAGDTITGTWQVETLPHKDFLTAADGTTFDRVSWGRQTIEVRVVLNRDGTLTESGKASGVSENKYGPTAPKVLKDNKNEWTTVYPGKDVAGVQGTWKERRGG